MQIAERLFGLIGYPLSHSFSKKYFTEKFEREQILQCRYELFPIQEAGSIRGVLANQPDLAGFNITIPHKESILPYLDELSPAVKEIGACNCVIIKNNRLIGYNTDVVGFEKMLLPFMKSHHHKALILGTGGAAKAVAWVFRKLGIEYMFVSREAGSNKFRYSDIDESLMSLYNIIVNTTPLGMSPDLDAMPDIPYHLITEKHLFVDLIYNPEKTRFLSLAEQRGATIVNGLKMLIIQAEESWKIWNENDQGK